MAKMEYFQDYAFLTLNGAKRDGATEVAQRISLQSTPPHPTPPISLLSFLAYESVSSVFFIIFAHGL